MKSFRIAWAVVSLVLVQTAVCGLSSAPIVLVWLWLESICGDSPPLRATLFSLVLVPSYLVFTLMLLFILPATLRALGWRTAPDREMRIADCEWALLDWARYAASLHLARVLAGDLLKGTPVWTAHLRWCGAHLGRRVYINSVSVSDYNLITFGDDVVIGDAVHLSGHTVEGGVVKTGSVTLGNNVTIGLGTVVEIGARIGSNVQIGALSFVPKRARLDGPATYAGVPVRPLE